MSLTDLPYLTREIFREGLITRVEFRKYIYEIEVLCSTSDFEIDKINKKEQIEFRILNTISR